MKERENEHIPEADGVIIQDLPNMNTVTSSN